MDLRELSQKGICIPQLELGICRSGISCQYVHDFSHVEVFQLYNVIREVQELPDWLQSSRPKIDRLLSIYHLQAATFRTISKDGQYLAMDLLNRILTDIRDIPLNTNDNVFFTLRKLFSDLESLYPTSTFSTVSVFAILFF